MTIHGNRLTGKIYSALPTTARIAAIATLASALFMSGAPARAFDINAGQKVYEEHCANCHGVDGVPLMAGTPDFSKGETLDTTDVALIRSLRAGRNLMPSYDGLLEEKDLLNVVTYLRTLRR